MKNEDDNNEIKEDNKNKDQGKRNYKDSIFRGIFKYKKAFKVLYEFLTGNKLHTGIKEYGTGNVLTVAKYRNDVAFLTKDNKSLIIVEHQSTPNPNMALRSLFYAATLLDIYIRDNNLTRKLHSATAVEIPKVEIYVVYNGGKDIDTKEYTLQVNNNSEGNSIYVTCIIKYIRFDKLDDEYKKLTNEVTGYAYLIDRISYYHKVRNHSLEDSIKMGVDDCIKSKYLLEYIKERKEFIIMLTVILSEEDMQEIRFEDGKNSVRNGNNNLYKII